MRVQDDNNKKEEEVRVFIDTESVVYDFGIVKYDSPAAAEAAVSAADAELLAQREWDDLKIMINVNDVGALSLSCLTCVHTVSNFYIIDCA
jgi:hypothetical protein